MRTEKVQILVVEDENIVARDIQSSLKRYGYSVPITVSSGEDAIKRVQKSRPDLVLMDIVLKGKMDGIEVADRIHTQFDIPVIYLTAYADENTLRRAKRTEPFGYILKPFEEKELQTTIEMALYKHKIEKRLKESEQWLATTLKSIGDAILATDTHHNVTFMNSIAETLTGWTFPEAKGKEIRKVLTLKSDHAASSSTNFISHFLKRRRPQKPSNHLILVTRDKREIPIEMSAEPILEKPGIHLGLTL